MSSTKLNPVFEAMLISLITGITEQGSEFLFQKMVDKNKDHATTVLQTLSQSIKAVADANHITL